LPRSTLIRSSAMVYIAFFRSSSHVPCHDPLCSRRYLTTQHSTLNARMERCFILATTVISRGWRFGQRVTAALSALALNGEGTRAFFAIELQSIPIAFAPKPKVIVRTGKGYSSQAISSSGGSFSSGRFAHVLLFL